MADKDENKNYFLHLDELSRRLAADQRSLTEENLSCLAFEELLEENEKVYKQIQSEIRQLQAKIEECEKREHNFENMKRLQSSTLEMLEENTVLQDAEIALLVEELEEVNQERNSLIKVYYSKLEESKVRLGPHLVDDSVTEKSLKRNHLIQQKNHLESEVAIEKKNYIEASLEDWKQFKSATLILASNAVKLEEEEKKRNTFRQKLLDLEIDVKQKQLEQKQLEYQQIQEQQKFQLQQQWQRQNQEHHGAQQPQHWQSPQSCNISSVSLSPNIPMNKIPRQDTPRPKPHLGLTFSLPKLQFPKFGGKGMSISVEEPKGFEGAKFTGTRGDMGHFNHSIQNISGTYSSNVMPPANFSSDFGPPSYASTSTVNVEAGKSLYSSLGGTSGLTSQNHSPAVPIKNSLATESSNSLNSHAGISNMHANDLIGDLPDSGAHDRFHSSNTSVANTDLRNNSPYFETAKRSLIFTPGQETHVDSPGKERKRQCKSVPPTSLSGDTSSISKESPEVQKSSAFSMSEKFDSPETSSISFHNRESWKAYLSSLMKSPEIVYTKPSSAFKTHHYETTGPETYKPIAGTSLASETSLQPCTSHRIHVEELPVSGEALENTAIQEEQTTRTSDSNSKEQISDVHQESVDQPETSLTSSQGFSVSREGQSVSQQSNNDSTISSSVQTTSVTSSVTEVHSNLNSPAHMNKQQTNYPKYFESPSLTGPSTSTPYPGGNTHTSTPVCQPHVPQQMPLKGPGLCSTPKSFESSKQVENRSHTLGESSSWNNGPGTIYSGCTTGNSFSPLFSNEAANDIFGSKGLRFLDLPGQSQESESDRGTSGIGFSLFGDSTSQQEESSNFFTFNLGGSLTQAEDRSRGSREVFSLFSSDPADSSEDSGFGANFKLF